MIKSKDIESAYRSGVQPRIGWADINWSKVGGGFVFILGVFFTMRFFGLPWLLALLVAIPVQLALTKLESPIFRRWVTDAETGELVIDEETREPIRRRVTLINWAALFFDGAINALGIWAWVKDLHTRWYAMELAAMLELEVQPVRGPVALLLCFLLGILVAMGFERLWYDAEYVH